MSDVLIELRRKEQQIQDLQAREQRRQGQEDTLKKQLQEGFGLDTTDAATKKLTSISGEIAQIETNLQSIDQELEKIIEAAVSVSAGGADGSEDRR